MARAWPGQICARIFPPRLNAERATALELRRESRHRANMDFALAIDHVQVAMPVSGEARARAFFGALLGLAELPKPPDMAARGGCWFALGDRQLHLGVEADFRAAKKAHVALATDALDALRARLDAAGFVTHDDSVIDGRYRFFTEDPFGNRIEFMDGTARA